MPLPTSSLAKICNVIREHVDTLGMPTSPANWEVTVTIGAPGANLSSTTNRNVLNLFFYRFEPFSFAADARPGDVQWVKMFCVITAFGMDEDVNNDDKVDFSAGFNELCMLSQVMRLFQERPVMLVEGDDAGEMWHIQFIQRPLADEQINQIWSTQGETIYRPSLVYEITLAPVEPLVASSQSARVASVGTLASSKLQNKNTIWPADRATRYPSLAAVTVDPSNPQWAPAIMMLSGTASTRQASLSLHLQVPDNGANADFSNFPELDIWIAGDTAKTNNLTLVGQLLQNPDADKSAGKWQDIQVIQNISADTLTLDPEHLPETAHIQFTLSQSHWTNISAASHSWQLQLFAERYIRYQAASGEWLETTLENATVRMRSNPLLISITREAP